MYNLITQEIEKKKKKQMKIRRHGLYEKFPTMEVWSLVPCWRKVAIDLSILFAPQAALYDKNLKKMEKTEVPLTNTLLLCVV